MKINKFWNLHKNKFHLYCYYTLHYCLSRLQCTISNTNSKFLAFLNCTTLWIYDVVNIYVRNILLCLIRFALPGIQAAFCFLVHSRNITDHSLGIRSFTRSCQETLLTVICECFSNVFNNTLFTFIREI